MVRHHAGENNCNGLMGNAAQKVGYGCEMVAMVDLGRKSWSKIPGTTEPLAPFGIVTLASGGSEGGPDIGGMRWSQTGNYGTLPSLEMPNTFLAHAYDLGDPWQDNACVMEGCCPNSRSFNKSKCPSAQASACADACKAMTNTSYYMGPIHPRIKSAPPC